MRGLITLLVILGCLAAAWTGGWFALAAWARGQVSTVLAEASERGIEVECKGRDIVGFPFALKLACADTEVAERGTQSQARFAGLTGGASVFAPRTATISLASPAEVVAPALSAPAALRWSDADVDVGIGLNGPRDFAFDADDLAVEIPGSALPVTALTAQAASGRLAPAAEGGSDVSVRFTGLAVSAPDASFPPVDGTAAAVLSAPPRALLGGRANLPTPLWARSISVRLSSGDAVLQATGNLSADEQGVIDGMMTVRVAGTEALPGFIAALPPEHQPAANAVAGGLLAFGKPAEVEGERASELTVEIVRGRARIGPVEVSLPRLPL